MSKLNKRLERLEIAANPPRPTKAVRVIQEVGETEAQAIERAGIEDQENTSVILRQIVEPKARELAIH